MCDRLRDKDYNIGRYAVMSLMRRMNIRTVYRKPVLSKSHPDHKKYFSSFLDLIYDHGGDINETAGDGLMVIFQGEPKKTALAEVKAALEIRNKTMEINEELKNRFLPVEINMGINSGTATVGMSRFTEVSGTRMTFTATGPVTNVAARIASAAKHGDILVGPETARREVEDEDVTLFDRGLMNFKNVSEPVQVFSLVRRG